MNHLGTKYLETERLILRKFELTDVEDMYYNWANDDEVTRYITWATHKSIEDTKKVVEGYVNESTRDNYYHWCIVLKETNRAVGSIGAFRLYDDVKMFEVGYCIGKKFWNMGITTEAMKALFKFFFEEVGVNKIEAIHDTKNPASGKVMTKAGMQLEGILRQSGKNNTGICDSAVYGILREDWLIMNNKLNVFIKLKENIDESDYKDINKLKDSCFDYDKTCLKLETDYKLNNVNTYSDNLSSINEFMVYKGTNLIAYAGICDFGGESLEVNGMVHPDYRRKGIFTRIFSLVKDEFSRRDTKEMLLLCDNNSVGGMEFIKKASNSYAHSEYDMNLDMNVTHEISYDDLVFRKALKADAENIAKENFEFFGDSDFEGIADETGALNSSSCTYLLELNNVVIGKSRLEINENFGGIYGLEVLHGYRGKGFGRKLLILSINKLKESNVKAITLQVETNNKNALNLYTSCGFKENYTMSYYSIKK